MCNNALVTIQIYQDEDPTNPREWSNIGTLALYHRRMTLGDTPETKPDRAWIFKQPSAVEDYLAVNKAVVLRVRAYEHGQITLTADPLRRTRHPFTDPWDSAEAGVIFATEDDIFKNWPNWKKLSKKRVAQVKEILIAEVEEYNSYLRGESYGFTVDSDALHVQESVWGYPTVKDAVKEAISYV